jgi:hypothetical protein
MTSECHCCGKTVAKSYFVVVDGYYRAVCYKCRAAVRATTPKTTGTLIDALRSAVGQR